MPTFFKRSRNKQYQFPTVNKESSEFEVNKWILSEFIVDKILPFAEYSPYPIDELILMAGTVCRFKPTHIFEWGTHIGKSARIFYEVTEHFKIDSEIHSFDLPDDVEHVEHPHEKRGHLVRGLKRVKLYQEDGLIKSFELYEQSAILNKRALFYVDGDHSYETVYRELETILDRTPNAIVLLHDTFFQSQESGYNVGPFMAVKDVLAKSTINFHKVETTMGLPGMTLIYS